MRSRTRLLPAVASLACALLVVAAPVAQAQDASPDATPSAFCAVLTPAEIETAMGIPVTITDSTDIDCTYEADFSTGVFLLLNVRAEEGTVDQLKEFFNDYKDVTVAGRPAIISPDATLLFVGLDEGLFTIQLVGSPATGIDAAAAITSLAETALTRLDGVPLPSPTPEPSEFPMPSFVGDPDLVALFPATLGGEPLLIQSFSGAEIRSFGDPDAMAQVEETLAAAGKTFDDLSLAFGYSVGGGGITAIRVRGMDVASVLEQFLPLLLDAMEDPVQTPTQIAGKSVIKVTDGEGAGALTQYLYPSGEVIWQVTAEEPVLTEAFAALP